MKQRSPAKKKKGDVWKEKGAQAVNDQVFITGANLLHQFTFKVVKDQFPLVLHQFPLVLHH